MRSARPPAQYRLLTPVILLPGRAKLVANPAWIGSGPIQTHRIAIITTQPVANIDDPTIPVFRAFFEGQNLTVERYSGEGRPEGFCQSRSRGRQPEPGCDRRHWWSDHSGRQRSDRHNTDRRLRRYQLSSRAASGAAWRQHHWYQGDGVRDLWKALADPQRSRPFGIQGRVPGHPHVLGKCRRTDRDVAGFGPVEDLVHVIRHAPPERHRPTGAVEAE